MIIVEGGSAFTDGTQVRFGKISKGHEDGSRVNDGIAVNPK
jgi:hypothetical protein